MTCLIPPFRGKDMKDLYKKVCSGKYSPIPPHYSNSLRKVIAELLNVDSLKRPSCDELL